RQVIEYGGLFPFNVARIQGKVSLPAITTGQRPMTIAEKIFAKHMVNGPSVVTDRPSGTDSRQPKAESQFVKPGDSGFVRCDLRFSHEYVTPMAAIFYEQKVGKDVPVNDRDTIKFFRDHLTFLDEVI